MIKQTGRLNFAYETIAQLEARVIELEDKLLEANARVGWLKAGYQECLEDLQDWSSYADAYFQDKYGLTTTIENHNKIIED
jgi:hypothetical protein